MIRQHPITGEPIVYAPERAARPHAFVNSSDDAHCPFCPGNEHETPPELARIGDPWRARVFPNKYPPLDGAEVIVESNRHDSTFATIDDADEVVALTFERYAAHPDAKHVALFKNEGARAGSSIAHIHSQLVPLPFVPPRIARDAESFARAASCPLCAEVDRELVIDENEQFVRYAPFGSSMPYEQWIVPRTHASEMSDPRGLGEMLVRAAGGMERIADSYNWLFQNFRGAENAHWYVELFPRVTTIAGFELSTGTFVEIVDPAAAARQLK